MRFVFQCFLFVFLTQNLFAQDTHKLNASVEALSLSEKDLYKKLADELRCPTCTGLSVLQSDAAFSVEIKSALVEQIREGKKEKDILSFFKERFGLWILRTPPKEGFHWFAWYVPIGLMIFGAFAVWGFFWRRRKEPEVLGIRPAALILQEMERDLEMRRKVK